MIRENLPSNVNPTHVIIHLLPVDDRNNVSETVATVYY